MLTTFWADWGSAIEWAVAAVGGWWARSAAARIQRQRNQIDATNAHTEEMRLALERERALSELASNSRRDAQDSWRTLYEREAVLIAYHAAAIGARLKVHEQEVASGKTTTQFEPLPGYPPVNDAGKNAVQESINS